MISKKLEWSITHNTIFYYVGFMHDVFIQQEVIAKGWPRIGKIQEFDLLKPHSLISPQEILVSQ